MPFGEIGPALDAIDYCGACTMEIIDTDADAAIRDSHRALAVLGIAPALEETIA